MPSASPLPSPSPSSSSLLGHHNNHENENDHHHLQQLPSKYWKALMRQLHQPSAEGTLLLLLDTILLIIFLIGVWGAAQSLGGLHDFACRDVERFVLFVPWRHFYDLFPTIPLSYITCMPRLSNPLLLSHTQLRLPHHFRVGPVPCAKCPSSPAAPVANCSVESDIPQPTQGREQSQILLPLVLLFIATSTTM